MIKTAVARRYAKALFDLLDRQSMEPARAALQGLGQAIEQSADLRHAIASPAFAEQDKVDVLNGLANRIGLPPIGKNFLGQLVRKSRVGFLPEIAAAFAKLVDESKGTQRVAVSSAAALRPEEQDRIRARLRDVLKHDVEVLFETQATQMAGLLIRLGSTVVDSTVRGRLTAMQRLLTKE
ncbi:MAG: ATP synthase F1 subunit delta [Nitrospiraceae bacterium]